MKKSLIRSLSAFSLTALLGLSMNAHASLMNVKSIEISNVFGSNSWLQVAEVLAFNTSGINKALATNGATAYAPDSWSSSSTANKAIDGNTNGNYNAGFLFHEGQNNSHDTLKITLAAITTLDSFQIFGRTDCCSSRDIYTVVFKDNQGMTLKTLNNVNATGSTHSASFTLVPEPASIALFGLGLLSLTALRRRQA